MIRYRAHRPQSLRWGGMKERFGQNVRYGLWVADMDIEVCPHILEALQQRISHPVFGYDLEPKGLKEAILSWHQRRYGVSLDPEWIVYLPSVLPGMALGIEGYQSVAIQSPVYPPFFQISKDLGMEVVTNPLQDNRMNLSHLRSLDFDALILCSPHNPVGRVWSVHELGKLSSVVGDRMIVSDEIHCDLAYMPYTPMHTIHPRTISLYAASKSFNIAGLGFAYGVIQDDTIRQKFVRKLKAMHLQPNPLGMLATMIAYERCEGWLEEVKRALWHNMELVRARLHPAITFSMPEGGYLMWLDFGGLGLSHKELKRLLYEKAGVALSDGLAFGSAGYAHFRLNVATDPALLEEAIEKINEAIKEVV